MFYCPISIYSCPIPLTFSKLMFDLPYFVSDSSYGYQSDLHDDNFVRRKQRRNRTTFTVQQVKEKKRTFSWTFHLLSTSFLNCKIWVFNLHPLFCTWAEFSVSRIFENCVLRVGNTCKRTSLGLVAWKEIVSLFSFIFFLGVWRVFCVTCCQKDHVNTMFSFL